MKKPNEKHTAYHEAGHVVADLWYDHVFESVTIVPDFEKGYAGIVNGNIKDFPLHLAVLRYAGAIAEAKLRRVSPLLCGYSEDMVAANNLMDNYHGAIVALGGRFPCRKRLGIDTKQDARRIINHDWDKVQVIAEALLKRKTLTYSEVLKVVADMKMQNLEG
jgi:hypothetical protein